MLTAKSLTPVPAALQRTGAAVCGMSAMVVRGTVSELRRRPAREAPRTVARTDFDPTALIPPADRHAALAQLHEHRVQINEQLNIWMLSRYDDVSTAARAHNVLSSLEGIVLRSAPMPSVLTTDEPDHTRLRHILAPAFNPAAIRRFESTLGELIDPAIQTIAGGDVADVVGLLSEPLPITAIAVLMGIDRSRWSEFRRWSHDFTAIVTARSWWEMATLSSRAFPSTLALRALIAEELQRRRDQPSDDILGRLATALTGGEMTEQEAHSAAFIILLAGSETTTNLLGTLLMVLAQDPELYSRLRHDRTRIAPAIEETLRWESPVQWVARTTTEPYPVGDVVIPPNSRVVLCYAAANRDPRRYADPERFDIDRGASGHLGFGHGAHVCMGAHLARVEVRLVLDRLLDRVEALDLAGAVRWTTTPSLSGPSAVPVRAHTRRHGLRTSDERHGP